MPPQLGKVHAPSPTRQSILMDNKAMNIEEEIDVALVRLGWPEESFLKCDRERARTIVRSVEDTFLTERRWQWWTALKKPFAIHDCEPALNNGLCVIFDDGRPPG